MRTAAIIDRLAGLGSDKWQLHHRGRELGAQGHPVIELTIGEPDVPPDPRLLAACEAAMRAGRTRYSNGRGEPALVEALAAKYSRRAGRAVTPREILCFPGTQTALYAVMTGLVDPGDKVLLPDPYYATYEGVVRAPGAEIVPVPLRAEDGFHLRPEALERAITPGCRVLMLNSPHNPSGATLSRAEIAAIGEICRRHDLWIVSDEVYEALAFGPGFASPFDLPELAERTVVVASISKSHAAPGFRSGWAVGPAALFDRLLSVCETMLFGNQPFIADMTAQALTQDLPTAAIMRENYARRAALVAGRLGRVPGLRPMPPEGGMFILVDVGGTGLDGATFAARLLEEAHVSVMPGSSFGAGARNFLRLSLTVPDEALAEACARIARFTAGLGAAPAALAS